MNCCNSYAPCRRKTTFHQEDSPQNRSAQVVVQPPWRAIPARLSGWPIRVWPGSCIRDNPPSGDGAPGSATATSRRRAGEPGSGWNRNGLGWNGRTQGKSPCQAFSAPSWRHLSCPPVLTSDPKIRALGSRLAISRGSTGDFNPAWSRITAICFLGRTLTSRRWCMLSTRRAAPRCPRVGRVERHWKWVRPPLLAAATSGGPRGFGPAAANSATNYKNHPTERAAALAASLFRGGFRIRARAGGQSKRQVRGAAAVMTPVCRNGLGAGGW